MKLGGLHRKILQQAALRPDVIPYTEVRTKLLDLFADNPPRPIEVIESQAHNSLAMENLKVHKTLKVGTIGEVSLVRDTITGSMHALKTTNLKQELLFQIDFEIMRGDLLKTIETAFGIAKKAGLNVDFMQSLVKQVINLGNNKDWQEDTMREFALREECTSMNMGREWLDKVAEDYEFGKDYFRVPAVLRSSNDTLLMEYIDGKNLIDVFPKGERVDDALASKVMSDLVALYVHGLIIGPILHADLHPGNVLLSHRMDDSGFEDGLALVDWGVVCEVPKEKRIFVAEFLEHCAGETRCDLKALYANLDFHPLHDLENSGSDVWTPLTKLFDLVAQGDMDPDDLEPVLQAMNSFQRPRWVNMWEKATGALTASLKYLGASQLPNFDLNAVMQEKLRQARMLLGREGDDQLLGA